MPEKVMPGPVEGTGGIREAVCVHTRKIYDSCRDKDCIEDLRFYPKLQYVDVINHALSVKGGSADLLYVYVDVEPVNFNRGFYTVDMRFFYNVTLQAYTSCPAPVTVEGLCVFDKRAILFGSEGSAKIFSSKFRSGEPDIPMLRRSNLPEAVVEAVDPIVLDARLVESGCSRRDCDCDLCEVPPPSASASAGSFAAETKAAGSTLLWGSSPSSVWSGIPSSWCRCTITVCRRKSAPAAAPTILAACSATSISLWANFSRPTPWPSRRITRRPRTSAPAVINKEKPGDTFVSPGLLAFRFNLPKVHLPCWFWGP